MTDLRNMLEQDADSPEDVEALLPVLSTLQEWQTAPLDDAQKRIMTAQLQQALQKRNKPERPSRMVWARLILKAQFRVIQQEIWWASALMFALGGIVTAFFYASTGMTLALTFIAPLIAVSGIALLYNAEIEEVSEIEHTMPIPLPVIILARLTLVFAFDTILGIGLSIILALLFPTLAFWPLILSWFIPMTFLSSLAFFISVMSRDSATGIAISLALWVVYTMWRYTRITTHPIESGFVIPQSYPILLVAAGGLLGTALWVTTRENRKVGNI